MIDKLYLDKTLAEISEETEPHYTGGYSVFVLYDENDPTGREIDLSYSVKAILKHYPEISNYIVKRTNDFYGIRVLRVIRPKGDENDNV